MKEIQLLPQNLQSQPSTQIVQHWYKQSFLDVIKYAKSDPQDIKVVAKYDFRRLTTYTSIIMN